MEHGVDDITGKFLLELARQTIQKELTENHESPTFSDPSLEKNSGTFVTLKLAGKLRGCIGNIEPVKSIEQGIRDNALNAAFHDHRFSPLTQEELDEIHIGISILSVPQVLEYGDSEELLEKLQPGVDGVILKEGSLSATFLPQVWLQLPEPEQFLTQLCIKAGLSRNAWRDSQPEVLVYQVQSFEEDM